MDEVLDGFLSAAECEALLAGIRAYASTHELPLIVREDGDRALRYKVIDGDAIHASLPELLQLYDRVRALVQQRDPRLEPLPNRTASVNVNLTPPGGEYRWHYDRNAVTAILYLNAVDGGETEMYPNFRVYLARWKDSWLQRALDRFLRLFARRSRLVVVTPAPGRMVLMRGDRCLHSVRRVASGERINVIMTFDLPGSRFRAEDNLDPYLYSRSASPDFDPNYRKR
jgi:2OG-Fe(II) oxygenase superfamily